MRRLPDTGQNAGFTNTPGEDADFVIHPLSFTDNGDGTVTDNITGLIWQKTDGGEMTIERAMSYCDTLTLAGYSDWRLPTNHELFSLNKYDVSNPALNTVYFSKTTAEYWWTSDRRADDAARVWVINAGGGTGAHPKTETLGAGGTKRFHVRAVRNPYAIPSPVDHFTDNNNGTITDNYTGLVWQKIQPANTLTWEEALAYAADLSLAGESDWRLPNVKELQSLSDEKLSKPSLNKTFFTGISSGNFWSATTLAQQPARAWDINVDYGIVSYNDKTVRENVLCVRGGLDNISLNIKESHLPGGEYEMGDHHGFVDPSHPSDELPLHKVKVNPMYMSTTETTNAQFLAFLNTALLNAQIEVRSNVIYRSGSNDILGFTRQSAAYYSIGFDGKVFSISDFRSDHPVVGVMWQGAIAFCNWLSVQNGFQECYDLSTGKCDFTKNGYRLPTEAEWEYAGRGGQTNPYWNYPWGNDQDIAKANWPNSKDPYEGTGEAAYPFTTPVGFYNGNLHEKTEFNWPGSALSYQTANGVNAFGLYDMAGNVWEFVNDWYGNNYYAASPYDNPKGPDSGFIMPDGKPYRGMRGGNWYNGYTTTGVNDGHSRVSNRNPSYFRGPQDPNHPWYHVGFRVARNDDNITTGLNDLEEDFPGRFRLYQNYPNPFYTSTTIRFTLPEESHVVLTLFNALGQELKTMVNQRLQAGIHEITLNGDQFSGGLLFYSLKAGGTASTKKMILVK